MHFEFTPNTDDSYSIIVDGDDACELVAGDEIGVFDGALCVGASVVSGSWPLPITAWHNDPQTPAKDGYDCANPMSFRIWRHVPAVERIFGPAGDQLRVVR
jgi:hypothetical protein